MASLAVKQPVVYYRNTQNDLPEKIDKSDSLLLRIASAALPIVSLYKPVQYLFQNGLSFTRVLKNAGEIINSYSEGKYYELTKGFFDISFSIASLSAGVFANAYGLFFSTLHDVGLNSYDCIKLLSDDSYTHLEFLKRIMNTTSSCLYLVAMFYGSLEIQVASLSVLFVTELVSALREYTKEKEGDWLQVLSHAIMAVARGYQLVPQVKKLQEKWALEKTLKECDEKIYSIPVDEIAEYAKENCVNEGVLQKNKDYVYIKLDEQYLDQVFNKIKENNPDVKMPSFRNGTGPHISIIRHDEWNGRPATDIPEIGTTYSFIPNRVDIITKEHSKLWVLVVEPSPELQEFRCKYVEGSMPHGHEFHVTMAIEYLDKK